MRVLDLFSGIGGFSLAAHWAGMETVAFVEIDPYCQKVLEKNFNGRVFANSDEQAKSALPINAESRQGMQEHENRPWIYPDITRFDARRYAGTIDIVCGGFPCQPFSCAGKRKGKEDVRHLWPEMLRVISEVRPTWVIGENVAGIIRMELDNCISDLEGLSYDTQAFVIPACAVDAPHRRDRVWIVAHDGLRKSMELPGSIGTRRNGITDSRQDVADACIGGLQGLSENGNDSGSGTQSRNELIEGCDREGKMWNAQSLLGVRPYGFPSGVVGWGDGWEEGIPRVAQNVPERVNKLRALGNAIVPAVAYQLFRAIKEVS